VYLNAEEHGGGYKTLNFGTPTADELEQARVGKPAQGRLGVDDAIAETPRKKKMKKTAIAAAASAGGATPTATTPRALTPPTYVPKTRQHEPSAKKARHHFGGGDGVAAAFEETKFDTLMAVLEADSCSVCGRAGHGSMDLCRQCRRGAHPTCHAKFPVGMYLCTACETKGMLALLGNAAEARTAPPPPAAAQQPVKAVDEGELDTVLAVLTEATPSQAAVAMAMSRLAALCDASVELCHKVLEMERAVGAVVALMDRHAKELNIARAATHVVLRLVLPASTELRTKLIQAHAVGALVNIINAHIDDAALCQDCFKAMTHLLLGCQEPELIATSDKDNVLRAARIASDLHGRQADQARSVIDLFK